MKTIKTSERIYLPNLDHAGGINQTLIENDIGISPKKFTPRKKKISYFVSGKTCFWTVANTSESVRLVTYYLQITFTVYSKFIFRLASTHTLIYSMQIVLKHCTPLKKLFN